MSSSLDISKKNLVCGDFIKVSILFFIAERKPLGQRHAVTENTLEKSNCKIELILT
jgi:hypothetical protein